MEEKDPNDFRQQVGVEFEYVRHGTLCLFGNWDVVLGQVIAPTIGRTRTEFDFAWHIHDTIATDPKAKWNIVLDNLNIHCSESLVLLVANIEGIPRASLGKKGRSGIVKSVATRREFLADPSHRVSFVFTPETYFLAESGRNDFRDHQSTSDHLRCLSVSGRVARSVEGVHRILQ